MPSVAVVIPARNEIHRLPATLAAIAAARARLAPEISVPLVLVADNGSSDGTAEAALDAAAELGLPLEVMPCPVPGKANAVAAAMPEAAAHRTLPDWVLFMDADNATDLTALAEFDLGQWGVWVASRTAPGAEIHRPDGDSSARRVMSAGMRLLTAVLVRPGVGDTQCGFKAFPAELVAPLFAALRDRSWVFDAELLALARRAGIPVHEAGVAWTEMAGSKVRPLPDTVASLRALLRIAARLRRTRDDLAPLRRVARARR